MDAPFALGRRLLFGHRGAPLERPENTIASFRLALELGVNALESDLHVTRDGHVMLAHDPDGVRMAGTAAQIRSSTRTEVERWDVGVGFTLPDGTRPLAGHGHRIPSLEDVLAEFPDLPLNLDIKQLAPDPTAALATLLTHAGAVARVLVTSFHERALRRLRRARYPGPLGLSRTGVLLLLALPAPLMRRVAPAAAAQLPDRLARPTLINRAHAAGMRVDIFTVNELDRARALFALGVDGVMTDDPRCVATALHR